MAPQSPLAHALALCRTGPACAVVPIAATADSHDARQRANLRQMHALRTYRGAKVIAYAFAVALACLLLALPARHSEFPGKPAHARIQRPENMPPPRPEPQLIQALTREQAIAINEARPVVLGGLQTALAFGAGDRSISPPGYRTAVDCLTAAVYYEAGGESDEGQRAVAQVVLNRVRHPAFPQTVCGVVYQGSELSTGCQFTFACDGSLTRQPNPSGWARARRVAEGALEGRVEPAVGMATHYHANWVVPYWAPNLDKIAALGNHVFYRWRGYWGQRKAFDQAYAGETPNGPRLAFAEKFLAGWDGTSGQAEPSSAREAPSRDYPLQPRPAADMAVRKLVADEMSGRLVADDPGAGAPIAHTGILN